MDLIRTARRALRLLDRPTQKRLIVLAVAAVALSVLDLVGLLLLAPLLGQVTGTGVDGGWLYEITRATSRDQAIVRLTLLAAGIFLLKSVLAVLLITTQTSALIKGERRLLERLLAAFDTAGWVRQQGIRPGEFVRPTSSSIVNLSGLLTSALSTVADGAVFVAVVTAIAVVDPALAVGTVCYLGFLGALYVRIVKRPLERRGQAMQHEAERMNSAVLDLIGGIRELTVRQRVSHFSTRAVDAFYAYIRAARVVLITNYGMRFFLETLLIVGVAILVVLVALLSSSINAALVSIGVLLAGAIRLLPALNTILVSVNSVRAYAPSVDVIESEFRRLGADAADEAIRLDRSPPRGDHVVEDRVPPSSVEALLDFDHVSFRYPTRRDLAVRDLSFIIRPGESIGVVGPSGSGKSTLVDLILGLLQPDEGTISVNGWDLQERVAEWRNMIGYVPQDIFLLADTLASNIRFGLDPAPDDEARMLRVVTVASLARLVEELPGGLDTQIGERGVLLSGGQRQRIGLARALYGDPTAIIMDEATSALDNETESEISRALNLLHGQITTIVIAHRLSTVRSCDRILFLENGSLRDIGTFDELTARNAHFRRLVELGSLVN